MLLSLLYVIARCLLGIPAVLLRRDLVGLGKSSLQVTAGYSTPRRQHQVALDSPVSHWGRSWDRVSEPHKLAGDQQTL